MSIRDEYRAALLDYLGACDEASLVRAGAIGRMALGEGLGVLDMVSIHHAALAGALPPGGGSLPDTRAAADRAAAIDLSNTFLCEALSPFEMTHRGFQEISASISRIVQFAAVVCHELRTPLTSLMNSVGMLSELIDAGPTDSEGKLLANIQTSIDILKARTDDLLDLVGFQSGTLSLHPRRVDVAALLQGVVERGSREKADVRIALSIDGPLPPLMADPVRLEQVVTNLLQNALKYGADGRRIDVRARQAGDAVWIEVQDYGEGVSLWDRMSIWQPNYRGPRHRGEIPGLGIGLALCRELVQQHHGLISLETEEGKGSLFRVELPLYAAVEGHNEGTGDRGR